MADGLCVEGTGNCDNDTVVKDTVDLLSISRKDCLNAKGLNTLKSSFYIHGDSGELCSNFRVNGVVTLGVHASADMLCSADTEHVDFTSLCPDNGDNCRKKRCADRYDSSESSDSGVAVLSCTDCSASSSSGTSDITDPGSPYSTTSTHSSNSESSDDSGAPSASPRSNCRRSKSPDMAPNVPSGQREMPWPWGGEDLDRDRDRGPPPLLALATTTHIANYSPKSLKRQTAIVNHKTAPAATAVKVPSNKRLKVEHKTTLSNNNNNTKGSTSPCVGVRQQPQRCCAKAHCNQIHSRATALQADASLQPKAQQQGKITEYFKMQMKPTSVGKKDLAAKTSQPLTRKGEAKAVSESGVGRLDKYFNFSSGTQPPYNFPSSKPVDEDDDSAVELNASGASPLQMFLWNNKYDVDGSSRSLKASPKCVAEKKNGMVTGTTTHSRKAVASSVTLKIPEIKKNGLTNVSPSLSSQKLNLLFLSPPSLQKSVSSGLAYCSKVVRPDTCKVVSGVPKPVSSITSSEASAASSSSAKPKSVSEQAEPEERSDSVLTCETSDASSSCLLVSVSASANLAHSLPSPILSVPRTIRFPAAHRTKSDRLDTADSVACRWSECDSQFDSSTGLLEHLQAKHVSPQVTCENYVCLWVGCKVYARTSCSRSWLERHVLSHGGNKPFCCIVDGCGQRFSSQTTLERHVNGHFNQTEGSTSGAGARRSVESASSKLFRRNGKKLRYRRQPWSARMFDYFDSGIMEGLQHRLMNMTAKRTQGNIALAPGNTITMHSKVMARRVELDGKTRVLLRWYPENIVSDEWLLESEVRPTRNVAITQLPVESCVPLHSALFSSGGQDRVRRPRKPGKPA